MAKLDREHGLAVFMYSGRMVATLAIARLTARRILGEGAFLVVGFSAAVLILVSQFLPFFGDADSEVRLVKDMGLATLVLAGALSAALFATAVVDEEMESRTAWMILAKPVGRGGFVLGKYLGILAAVAGMSLVLAAVLAFSVWRKDSYNNPDHVFRAAALDRAVLQGSVLALAETAVLAGLAVCFSCWVGPAPALAFLAAFFLAGHLAGLVPWLEGPVASLARVWIPDLGLFRISDAIGMGKTVPAGYMAAALAYAAAYVAGALLLAWAGIQRREVA